MITATSIQLKRGLDTTATFTVDQYGTDLWAKADEQIAEWAKEVTVGYEDIDFTITFEDGFQYSGTLEIGHPSLEKNKKLAEHIIGYASIYSGRRCPAHWNDQQYQYFLATYSKEQKKYGHILDTYQLG